MRGNALLDAGLLPDLKQAPTELLIGYGAALLRIEDQIEVFGILVLESRPDEF